MNIQKKILNWYKEQTRKYLEIALEKDHLDAILAGNALRVELTEKNTVIFIREYKK